MFVYVFVFVFFIFVLFQSFRMLMFCFCFLLFFFKKIFFFNLFVLADDAKSPSSKKSRIVRDRSTLCGDEIVHTEERMLPSILHKTKTGIVEFDLSNEIDGTSVSVFQASMLSTVLFVDEHPGLFFMSPSCNQREINIPHVLGDMLQEAVLDSGNKFDASLCIELN